MLVCRYRLGPFSCFNNGGMCSFIASYPGLPAHAAFSHGCKKKLRGQGGLGTSKDNIVFAAGCEKGCEGREAWVRAWIISMVRGYVYLSLYHSAWAYERCTEAEPLKPGYIHVP